MLIPLGILATAGAGGGGAYEWIATAAGDGTTTSTLTLSSIPSDYKHLQVRYFSRSTANTGTFSMRINGVTTSSYARHELIGSASTTSSTNSSSQTSIQYLLGTAGSGAPGQSYRGGVIDIVDYTSTSKNKTVRALYGGADNTQTTKVALLSGLFLDTTAITSLSFIVGSGFFEGDTRFALYGMRG